MGLVRKPTDRTSSSLLSWKPTGLPVEDSASAITMAVSKHQSLVVTAEPGAGKTSIVPLLVANVVQGRVLVLQPRRLAVRLAAQRLADLVSCDVGTTVGLTIRGERSVSNQTRIEVVTEAVLTNRLRRDPELVGVGAIIFDEFHERNLHSDLGLAMALESRSMIRDDLSIVVMSATLNAEPIAQLIDLVSDSTNDSTSIEPGRCPVLAVPGRAFPIETIYLSRPQPKRWAEAVAEATQRAVNETTGDVLVFVPGRREIDQVSRALKPTATRHGIDVLGLHGTSTTDIRKKVVAELGPRRIVVATAVAETSVTLPRVEAVVDGGLARRARFDPVTGMGRLETAAVTQFSADQRRGRAGRVGPGRCYRLWPADDHRHLLEATPAEILDGDPLPLAFALAAWGDPFADHLPFLDHPGFERLSAGQKTLSVLGLVDPANHGRLTNKGRLVAQLGLHPRNGALLVTAQEMGCAEIGLTAAALIDDPHHSDGVDFGVEFDRRRSEMTQATKRLRKRLGRNRDLSPSAKETEASTTPSGKVERAKSRPRPESLAELLAVAWPDRIASERPSRPGRYLIANGREAHLRSVSQSRYQDRTRSNSAASMGEFVIVVEADGEPRSATIRRAVPIDRDRLLEVAADQIKWHDAVTWDAASSRVLAQRRQQLGALVFHRQPLTNPAPDLVGAAMAEGIATKGLDALRWGQKATEIRARLDWLHQQSDDWPPVDDESLVESIGQWLDLSAVTTVKQASNLNVASGLLNLLDWRQRASFDDLAPTSIELGGRSRAVEYSSGRPVISVRLQFLLGCDQHPLIGPNNTPVVIELLTPANRPAQVTTDLPTFWRGSYQGVRADLRGRYPKHRWPEEPWETQPV